MRKGSSEGERERLESGSWIYLFFPCRKSLSGQFLGGCGEKKRIQHINDAADGRTEHREES